MIKKECGIRCVQVMVGLCMFSGIVFMGCVPTPHKGHESQFYLLSIEPAPEHEPCLDIPALDIRPCKIIPPFDGRHLVYQRDQVTYETDPYNLFMVPPTEQITHLLRQWYRSDDVHHQPSEAQKQHYILEAFVDRLAGDFTEPKHPVTSVRMYIQLSQRTTPRQSPQIIIQKAYRAQSPLDSKPSAQDIVLGFNHCLQQILTQFDTECHAMMQND